jgi:hypothetical protein
MASRTPILHFTHEDNLGRILSPDPPVHLAWMVGNEDAGAA